MGHPGIFRNFEDNRNLGKNMIEKLLELSKFMFVKG